MEAQAGLPPQFCERRGVIFLIGIIGISFLAHLIFEERRNIFARFFCLGFFVGLLIFFCDCEVFTHYRPAMPFQNRKNHFRDFSVQYCYNIKNITPLET